jgi:hypothetical protein
LNPFGGIPETVISDPEFEGPCFTLKTHNAASFFALEDSLGPYMAVGKSPLKKNQMWNN